MHNFVDGFTDVIRIIYNCFIFQIRREISFCFFQYLFYACNSFHGISIICKLYTETNGVSVVMCSYNAVGTGTCFNSCHIF